MIIGFLADYQGKENVECSNTSVCAKGEFCNFDFYESGFCESCPQSGRVVNNICEAQDFLFELGTEDCKKRCASDDEQIGNNRKFSADIEYL